jgi:hypothetical protein
MTKQNSNIAQRYISSGDTVRWFCIDWEFFGDARTVIDKHDEIFEILGSMKGAVEVNSGHTGVNVAFENIRRTNVKVIRDIEQRLIPVQKACHEFHRAARKWKEGSGGR